MLSSCDSSIKMGVFDTIRRLCESHELQFFVVVQKTAQPKSRFWSSSDLLNNLCGNLIHEFATYVDTSCDKVPRQQCDVKEEFSWMEEIDDEKDNEEEDRKLSKRPESPEVIDIDEDSVLLPEEEEECVLLNDESQTKADENAFSQRRKRKSEERPVGTISNNRVSSKRVCQGVFNPLISAPPPLDETSAEGFLEDSFGNSLEDSDASADPISQATNPISQATNNPNPILNPTIWKTFSFARPLRQTTVDDIFKKTLFCNSRYRFNERCSSNKNVRTDYSPLLLKILKKANPYCVPYAKLAFRKDLRRKCYLAEYNCRYTSCAVQANVEISCDTNNVTLEFINRKDQQKKKIESESLYTFIVFEAHDPGEGGEKQQVVSDRAVTVTNALSQNDLEKYFLNNLVDGKVLVNDLVHKVVSTDDYLDALAPIIALSNPFCTFKKPLTKCFVRKNRQKDNEEIRLLSVKLACSYPGCGCKVNCIISNPSGTVQMTFHRRVQLERLNNQDEIDESSDDDEESEVLMLDHSGTLEEVEAEEQPTDYVLQLPTKIEHEEPLSKEVIRKYIMVPAAPVRRNVPTGEKKQPQMRGSEYLGFIKPVVAKYNPNCFVVCNNSTIQDGRMKIYLRCKRKDCDFHCKVFVDGKTGKVSMQFRNYDSDPQGLWAQPFCYIRHPPDKKIYTLRKYDKSRLLPRTKDMKTPEIMRKYGLSQSQAENLKREFRVNKNIAANDSSSSNDATFEDNIGTVSSKLLESTLLKCKLCDCVFSYERHLINHHKFVHQAK